MRKLSVWSLALFQLLFAACKKEADPSATLPPPSQSDTNRQVYQVRGVVRELLSPTRAKIEHEEIPGYMAAMVMPLDAKNTNEFASLTVGDQISFDMVVTADDGWIEKVRVVGKTSLSPQTNTNQVPHVRRVREVEPLSVGDPMPDYPFTTEDGKPLRLSDLKGNAVGLSFIFTRCPFPTFCPRMNTNFEVASRELSKPGAPTNWHFLSLTIDPEYDTPARLKEYAKRYQRDPNRWRFVTSEMIEIDAITEQFGLVFANRNNTIDHNLRTVIIDAAGVVRQIYIGNEWDISEFIAEMKKAAAPAPSAP